jgi:hypothetical protein
LTPRAGFGTVRATCRRPAGENLIVRVKLALAAVAAGFVGALVPATAAQAYCDPVLSELYGRCTNSCYETARAYDSVDRRVGNKLPDDPFLCPA